MRDLGHVLGLSRERGWGFVAVHALWLVGKVTRALGHLREHLTSPDAVGGWRRGCDDARDRRRRLRHLDTALGELLGLELLEVHAG